MEIETVTIKSENLEDEYYPEEEVQLEDLPKEVSHSRVKQFRGKPFRCGVCGHYTTSDILLKVHMKMHLLKRVHQCNICKKCFSFITELNNHMLLHKQEAYHSLLRDHMTEAPPKVDQQNESPKKKFKNKNPNLPLNETEKFLLVKHIEKIGLNIKYKEMDQIKTFLRTGWIKMVEVFAENDYERNADKLARTYFHMKNQAKMHIERFYIHKKLPRPRKIDYIFVKLCPSDFEGLNLDMKELQEDSKIFDNDSSVKEELVEEEEKIEDMSLLANDSVEENESHLLNTLPSTSLKRPHSEDSDVPQNKVLRTEEDDDIKALKIKLLLADDIRKEKEHNLEVERKEFELKWREELHKKELELKNMEIKLLSQKIEQARM